MDEGISNRLCGPLVAVVARCCVRDGLLARMQIHEKHSQKQPAWIGAWQIDRPGRLLSIIVESDLRITLIGVKLNGTGRYLYAR